MIAEQIDLFDVMPPQELPWKERSYNPGSYYCHILAAIPKRVLSATESKWDNKDSGNEWEAYAMGIWHYHQDNWDWMRSIKMLSEYRDRGEPIWMVWDRDFGFIPPEILEIG